jgi:hypothetical protein
MTVESWLETFDETIDSAGSAMRRLARLPAS